MHIQNSVYVFSQFWYTRRNIDVTDESATGIIKKQCSIFVLTPRYTWHWLYVRQTG